MSTKDFKLAKAITRIVDDSLPALVLGESNMLSDSVTPTTAELLDFWFVQDHCDNRSVNFHSGQRQAILNTIYAHEVVNQPDVAGLLQEVAPEELLEPDVIATVSNEHNRHPKYAQKMATGTGKTWVLNALLAWQYLNYRANPTDERFTSNFLIVAPGLIVYDRLLDSFQGRLINGVRDFGTSDMATFQDLFVPDNFRQSLFGFLQSSVVTKKEIGHQVTGGGVVAITNWHLLSGKEDPDFIDDESDSVVAPGVDLDPKWVADSLMPATPGVATGNSLDVLDRRYEKGQEIQWLAELPSLCVFNDEAHHIQAMKKGDDVTQVEWQKSLTRIAESKGRRFIQIDFSATPYRDQGSGKRSKRIYFPHIVVDFDLNEAMKEGLVKAIALDRRQEVASKALEDLDFKAERIGRKAVALSEGQRIMLRAGLKRLQELDEKFDKQGNGKHPKMMVVCEDTDVTPLVEEFLLSEGLTEDDVLRVDSSRQGEVGAKAWEPIKEKLFNIDQHEQPKVIVSVLMLREGFDVNNICVIVPLRSSGANILLEQTVGRGLRLMWRGDEAIEEAKAETRSRIAAGLEPNNYFDLLFIIEHPKFSEWYEELLAGGLAVEVDDEGEDRTVDDVEKVELRPGFEAYDLAVPIVLESASEQMTPPMLNPMELARFPMSLEALRMAVGKGDKFIATDVQTGTKYGDYRVDGGIMSAEGYNDYLGRITYRITSTLGSDLTESNAKLNQMSAFPVMQTFQPKLAGWIDLYIRQRLFDQEFDPGAVREDSDDWRILLIDEVAKHILSEFAGKLAELQENEVTELSLVEHRFLSEIESFSVRSNSAVEARKCIYPKLRVPAQGGGLERMFIEWLDFDGKVEAFIKIPEFSHGFLSIQYFKADGAKSRYWPDFLVQTADDMYLVETKADSALTDENVKRKRQAALAWCDRINDLPEDQRDFRKWHYVLLGEQTTRDWEAKGGLASDLLRQARLVHSTTEEQMRLE